MTENNDERKRAHLRLVVNNVEKRSPRPEDGGEDVIPFEELAGMRDVMRPEFYRELGGKPTKAYESRNMERYWSCPPVLLLPRRWNMASPFSTRYSSLFPKT